MAKNRAIVDVVTRITPPFEKPTARAFEARSDGFVIEFGSGETARLLRSDIAPALLDLLDNLRRDKTPVYVEVAGDGRAITRLLIPAVVKVVEASEVPGGDVDVVLFPSHARHTLTRKSEDFDALLAALTDGHGRDDWLLVTETERHEIIDVRPFRSDDSPLIPKRSSWFARLRARVIGIWLHRLVRWLTYTFCPWLGCPWPPPGCNSIFVAWNMFNLVAPKSCAPTNPQAPCIPFLYPDDGCWARAHEMCRLMIAAGAHPSKVWIDRMAPTMLHAATKNHPNCFVEWVWHVAPTLCVRNNWYVNTTYVIDPSLFTGPVTLATWKAVQGDPNAVLTHTAASIYFHNSTTTDPTYTQTNTHLAYYRNQLLLRSTTAVNPANGQLWGPPPYAHC